MAELNQRPVIGLLGIPLGTVAEIDLIVVSGDATRRKADSSRYLLKVTHVNGQQLADERLMSFHVPGFAPVKLANDIFALYELKHGIEAKSLDSAQIKEMEKGYVGQSHRLAVYEVGSFHGIPSNMPVDVPVWQDTGFHFSSSLVVLAERDLAVRKSKTK